jgi:transposase
MDALLEKCCGLDVHRDTVVACILTGGLDERPKKEIRTFATTSKALHELRAWLLQAECAYVAMESTGVYWEPVYAVLEDDFEILLANAQRIKNVPGRKTDVSDAEWIAKLLRSGLVAASFVPPRDIRELRDLTRYRRKLVAVSTAEKNRMLKQLERAGVKLASVVSDVFGKTGSDLLQRLMNAQPLDESIVKGLAKGNIKKKIPQLMEALNAPLSGHQRFMLRQSWDHYSYLQQQIEAVDVAIDQHLLRYEEEAQLLRTMPGMDRLGAASLIAEIGVDMAQFHSEKHLASWAGVSPGSNESAGKKVLSHP